MGARASSAPYSYLHGLFSMGAAMLCFVFIAITNSICKKVKSMYTPIAYICYNYAVDCISSNEKWACNFTDPPLTYVVYNFGAHVSCFLMLTFLTNFRRKNTLIMLFCDRLKPAIVNYIVTLKSNLCSNSACKEHFVHNCCYLYW